MSLPAQPHHTLLSCFALLFLLKQAESGAFLALSERAGLGEEEESLWVQPEQGGLAGGVQHPFYPSPDSCVL